MNPLILSIFILIGYLVFMKNESTRIDKNIGGVDNTWDDLFIKYGEKYKVNPKIMKGIAMNESYLGKYSSIEPIGGTSGLMHIKISTAKDYIKNIDSYDLYYSPRADELQIDAATQHMRRLLEKFNFNLKDAVQAYNAGEGRIAQVKSGKASKLPSTTVAYWERYNRNEGRLG